MSFNPPAATWRRETRPALSRGVCFFVSIRPPPRGGGKQLSNDLELPSDTFQSARRHAAAGNGGANSEAPPPRNVSIRPPPRGGGKPGHSTRADGRTHGFNPPAATWRRETQKRRVRRTEQRVSIRPPPRGGGKQLKP